MLDGIAGQSGIVGLGVILAPDTEETPYGDLPNLTPYSAPDYCQQLLDLLPVGRLWDALRRDNVIHGLLCAFAEELARIDARSVDLINETDPRTTYELLTEWEAFAGLPDPCIGPLDSVDLRRLVLHTRLTSLGGQSRQFFIDYAAALGIAITITEFEPATVMSGVSTPMRGTDWRHAWQVNAPGEVIVTDFTVMSGVSEPLRTFTGDSLLECSFKRMKPAHSLLIFHYES